ncbi:MAG TPA: glycosyltransferase [Candidatus Saccharimonadales bacterium]|nr:glycosyltransferase [Candidatus Saccharimonadales bacterium]
MKVALVVPHMFMHRDILPQVIFSPAALAVQLAEGLAAQGAEATLFSPGPVDTRVPNRTADLSLFEQELAGRGYGYVELLKKHPATFIALARQVQAELIASAFAAANRGEFDVVHIYTNEEDIALPFAQLCTKPVVFTHHDPFNFLIKYKSVFPKYAGLNWISMSLAQRAGMPPGTNWLANIYHGMDPDALHYNPQPNGNYVAYLGRIIEPKGVHLAIAAVEMYNKTAAEPLTLKIAGKHYAGHKDSYWQEQVAPHLGGSIEYVGFLSGDAAKQDFLGNARAVLVPSIFNEPFGLVVIEALACGTPVIGLNSGAIPEIITPGGTGLVVAKAKTDAQTSKRLAAAIPQALALGRRGCRAAFQSRFTLQQMCAAHLAAYQKAVAAKV